MKTVLTLLAVESVTTLQFSRTEDRPGKGMKAFIDLICWSQRTGCQLLGCFYYAC